MKWVKLIPRKKLAVVALFVFQNNYEWLHLNQIVILKKTRRMQGLTIKSQYVITNVCQNFGVRDLRGQIPNSMCQASYPLPSDFPNNFSLIRFYLNRMKDC